MPDKLTAALNANNQTAQNLGKGPSLGPDQVPENPTPQDVAQAVQKLDRVSYESDTADSYHAIKHPGELPQPPRSPDPVENANAYAMDTIKTGDAVDASRPVAGGSTRVIIQKTYPSPSGGEPQVMEAIVYIDPSGKVALASYGAAKAMPPLGSRPRHDLRPRWHPRAVDGSVRRAPAAHARRRA